MSQEGSVLLNSFLGCFHSYFCFELSLRYLCGNITLVYFVHIRWNVFICCCNSTFPVNYSISLALPCFGLVLLLQNRYPLTHPLLDFLKVQPQILKVQVLQGWNVKTFNPRKLTVPGNMTLYDEWVQERKNNKKEKARWLGHPFVLTYHVDYVASILTLCSFHTLLQILQTKFSYLLSCNLMKYYFKQKPYLKESFLLADCHPFLRHEVLLVKIVWKPPKENKQTKQTKKLMLNCFPGQKGQGPHLTLLAPRALLSSFLSSPLPGSCSSPYLSLGTHCALLWAD